MKKSGILNSSLARLVASLGHGDVIVIADCGLPVPPGIPVVDLAVTFGVPRFSAVFSALMEELVIDSATVAEELDANPEVRDLINAHILSIQRVPHEQLKQLTTSVKAIVRTGEATPYGNAILRCGVAF